MMFNHFSSDALNMKPQVQRTEDESQHSKSSLSPNQGHSLSQRMSYCQEGEYDLFASFYVGSFSRLHEVPVRFYPTVSYLYTTLDLN